MKTRIEKQAKLEAHFLIPDPVRRSAYEALAIAIRQPGSLVRVTTKDIEQTAELVGMIAYAATQGAKGEVTLKGRVTHREDWLSKGDKGPVMELSNGSGIEFAVPSK